VTTDLLPEAKMRTPAPASALFQQIWRRTAFRPYPLQRSILLDEHRNKVWAAGRRAGKSRSGGQRLLPEAFRAFMELQELQRRSLRREYWIVGPEYSDSEKEFRVFWDGCTRLGFPMDHPGSYNNTESGEMRVSLFGGRFIVEAKSAKYPTSLVGEGLSGAIFSEAAKLKPSVYWKFIRPTLADFGGFVQMGSTPEGKNWFYDLWMVGQDPDREDWASWRTPAWLNPYVYPQGADERLLRMLEEARNRKALQDLLKVLRWKVTDAVRHPVGIDPEVWSLWRDMPQPAFNQEEAALFNEYVGRVFKDFDEEIHVQTVGYRAGWETWACADYGFTNPFVWLLVQISPHGDEIHILDEYYETGKTNEEAAAEILARGLAPRSCRGFFGDPADPGATRTLSQTLKIQSLSPGSLTVRERIDWIRKYLAWGSGPGRSGVALTIERNRCPNTIREFGEYRYPETAEQAADRNRSAPENPQKKDDHTPEALGRFFSGRFGPMRHAARQTRAKTQR